ncbi:DMT family transporter [uncultured Ferrimonas sp.]|uniref:DMT family transporter n=1 Tax=uncultured Ferrimonas sp. TaxID=432640 RepID=UPI002628FF16|nr:DMT family transporter [uncultured Ferrimonas sp.]
MNPSLTTKWGASPRTTGIAIAFLGAVLMSFDPIFIRFSGVSGVDTAFLFGLFTALSMAWFVQRQDPNGLLGALRHGGLPLLLSGLLMLGSASSLVLSIKLTSVANTFVILSASPAIAALFSWLLLREVTSRQTWVAIGAVMIGIGIVVSGAYQSGYWLGDLLALVAVTCISLLQTLMRKFPEISRMASVGLGGALLALVMLIFAEPASYSLHTWLVMAAMGLFSAPFGRVLSQVATRYITAPEVGMILIVETVFAPLWAFGFFGEVPANSSFLGGAIILLTLIWYTKASNQAQ